MKESPSILKRMLSWALLCYLLLTPSPGSCTSSAEVLLQVKLGCGGKCFWGKPAESEMEMETTESETTTTTTTAAATTTRRRLLWGTQKRYISYEALREDVVPCSRAGVPYYNCRALPSANLYARGCEIITGCARDANP